MELTNAKISYVGLLCIVLVQIASCQLSQENVATNLHECDPASQLTIPVLKTFKDVNITIDPITFSLQGQYPETVPPMFEVSGMAPAFNVTYLDNNQAYIDYEGSANPCNKFTLEIEAFHNVAQVSISFNVTVHVLDCNEHDPYITFPTTTVKVPSDAQNGTELTRLVGEDLDGTDRLFHFSIESGDPDDLIRVTNGLDPLLVLNTDQPTSDIPNMTIELRIQDFNTKPARRSTTSNVTLSFQDDSSTTESTTTSNVTLCFQEDSSTTESSSPAVQAPVLLLVSSLLTGLLALLL